MRFVPYPTQRITADKATVRQDLNYPSVNILFGEKAMFSRNPTRSLIPLPFCVLLALMGIFTWSAAARGQVVIETVTVGNPGNPGDTRYPAPPVASFGGVAYAYDIGTFEVTAGQYRDFLNAVDPAGSNPYGLYNSSMDSNIYGCQITWNAGSSTYDFSGRPSGTESDWVDRPVNYVLWGDAARFCNWLHKGQPTGQLTGDPTQDAGLTEDGSYYLNGATSNAALLAVVREPDATWVIPSEDEWYKAAYHYSDGVTGNYWDYPTESNTAPTSEAPAGTDMTNGSANYYGSDWAIGAPYYRTEVGAYDAKPSDSPYATFDQGGNVWEWNEAVVTGSYRGLRGGSFYYHDYDLRAVARNSSDPSYEGLNIGFRVAVVCFSSSAPEPEKLALPGDPVSVKNRYLSFSAGDPGRLQAIRVTFHDIPAPYDTWEELEMWVGPPVEFCENSGHNLPRSGGCGIAPGFDTTFMGATLQCTPFFMDWHGVCDVDTCVGGLKEGETCVSDEDCLGIVNVYHEGIIPSHGEWVLNPDPPPTYIFDVSPAQYDIDVIDSVCTAMAPEDFSDPLRLEQSIWGDIVENLFTSPPGPPDMTVTVTFDVVAAIDKYRNMEPGAPGGVVRKTRADIRPAIPDQVVDLADVWFVVEAFKGHIYPPSSFPPPSPPPCDTPVSQCGNGTIEPGEQCDDGNRTSGDGCDLNCRSESCGNGTVDTGFGEECDDGPANSDTTPDTCRTNCTLPRCGDRVVDSGEACDDGNPFSGDGCENDCQITPGTTVLSLVPVANHPDGSLDPGVILCGNEMILPSGGHRVFLEIKVSNWAPGLVGVYQTGIDSEGYTSGVAGTLRPAHASCVVDVDCAPTFGPGSTCGTGHVPDDQCTAGFVDNTRMDHVLGAPGATELSTLDYRYGDPLPSLSIAIPDPGFVGYAGTLVLDVPVDAIGTFEVGLRPPPFTFLLDANLEHIGFDRILPARITIPIGDTSPLAKPEGEAGFEKNRYLSFVVANPGEQTALRVTLGNLPEPFENFECQTLWVGEPIEVCENSGQDYQQAPDNCGVAWIPDGPTSTMWSANLQADHYCHDFGSVGLLHVTDCEIVPGASYVVQAIACGADPTNEANYSVPLVINTSPWGDICGPWDPVHSRWSAPDGKVDIVYDVTAAVEKFSNKFGAPIKPRADVAANVPEWKVNITSDVTRINDAFGADPYPFSGPGTCPP